jgi:hypothetical protein
VAGISSGKKRFSFPGKDNEDVGSILVSEKMDQKYTKEGILVDTIHSLVVLSTLFRQLIEDFHISNDIIYYGCKS